MEGETLAQNTALWREFPIFIITVGIANPVKHFGQIQADSDTSIKLISAIENKLGIKHFQNIKNLIRRFWKNIILEGSSIVQRE